MNQWFMRRSRNTRIALVAVATFFGFAGLGGLAGGSQHATGVKGQHTVQHAASPQPVNVAEKQKIAVTSTRVETVEEEMPFTTTTTYDGTLPKDTTITRVEGQKGKKVVKTEVKTKDGVEVSRALISETITVPPVTKIVAIGTKVMPKDKPKQASSGTTCDPHYVECIPVIAADLDCDDIAMLVHVKVPGQDPHNFDANGDGIGCERYGED